MKVSYLILITVLLIGLLLPACSKKKNIEQIDAEEFLPEKVAGVDLTRSADIRVFAGNDLWEYIDGGAELYHSYNFIEVATADYKGPLAELVADVYRFKEPTDAFGIYSVLRPDSPTVVLLGIEGFSAPATIIFVRGAYLVRIMAYQDNESTNKAINSLAQEINNLMPGATSRPTAFRLFPISNVMAYRDKYYAESFLGHKFLPRIFAQDYYLNGDTATLFAGRDETGEKFLQWSEYYSTLGKIETPPDSLTFDSGMVFRAIDNFHGQVVAGLKNGKLLGMTHYTEADKTFLMDWINSIQ